MKQEMIEESFIVDTSENLKKRRKRMKASSYITSKVMKLEFFFSEIPDIS